MPHYPLSTEPLAQRIPISVHGAFIAVLCIGAVLVGMVGSPRPELGETFRLLLLAPIALVVYSLWHFRGKRAVHFLQGINLLWLAFAFFLGGMGVSVSGYDRSNPPYMDCPSTARA